MTGISLRGLTWDHPRATTPLYAALDSLRLRRPDISLQWDAQSLAGFEERAIAESTALYDLIVFDHPHVGEIAAQGLMLPLETALTNAGLADSDFVGPSLASYRFGGHVWGLPLDAAAQVCCMRPDLLAKLDLPAPRDWAEVVELGQRAATHGLLLGISYAGVHALMTLLSLCANLGAPLIVSPTVAFENRTVARRALFEMKELLSFCPAEVFDWDSIAAQEAMCARDDIVLCPAVYGFSTYSRPKQPRHLTYGNFPGPVTGAGGSTLGGAGIGVSSTSRYPDAALDVAMFLVEADVQHRIVALNSGQPARTSAWESPEVNHQADNFYVNTRATLEGAWVRPRFNHYLDFQRVAGGIVEAFLRGRGTVETTLDDLERTWTRLLSI